MRIFIFVAASADGLRSTPPIPPLIIGFVQSPPGSPSCTRQPCTPARPATTEVDSSVMRNVTKQHGLYRRQPCCGRARSRGPNPVEEAASGMWKRRVQLGDPGNAAGKPAAFPAGREPALVWGRRSGRAAPIRDEPTKLSSCAVGLSRVSSAQSGLIA
jgi:hypothetical protein